MEEPAQTYTYDSEGNLRATTSTGNSDETFQYDGADLTKQVAGGYGTYEYEYHNHNMTKATNDNVSVTASYDESGNSTGTKLRKKDNTGVYLQTSATYTPQPGPHRQCHRRQRRSVQLHLRQPGPQHQHLQQGHRQRI